MDKEIVPTSGDQFINSIIYASRGEQMSEFKLVMILNETFHRCRDETQNETVMLPAEFKSMKASEHEDHFTSKL